MQVLTSVSTSGLEMISSHSSSVVQSRKSSSAFLTASQETIKSAMASRPALNFFIFLGAVDAGIAPDSFNIVD